jgi:hypothetical protein
MDKVSFCMFVYVSLVLAACGAATDGDEQIRSEIIALARERSRAVVSSDTLTLGSILARDFRYINTFGEAMSRSRYLQGNASLGNDSSRWISQEMDSITVKVLQNTAVVTFLVLDKFIYKGVPYENYCRSTFVYEKQGDTWKCILGHTTRIGNDEE